MFLICALTSLNKALKLRNPIYSETAAYGHMGRVEDR
jgi:S-adenosylmethionine synthetase